MESEALRKSNVPEINKLYEIDPYLKFHDKEIRRRYGCFKDALVRITQTEGDLLKFAHGYKKFGIHVTQDNAVHSYEWAPGAKRVFLRGDFNDWDYTSHPYKNVGFGKWELHIPPKEDGSCPIKHGSVIKLVIHTQEDKLEDRLCPWAPYVACAKDSTTFHQVLWNPPEKEVYKFQHQRPQKPLSLRIYECHVGISSQDYKVASYDHFRENVIPRIVRQGYNAIQLMAIMEHAYYGSFGYQITSFYAASSRYGTPEELKHLIDAAHSQGLVVLLFMLLIDQIGSSYSKLQNTDLESGMKQDKYKITATLGLVVHAAADGIALGAAATTSHADIEMIVFTAIMLHKAPAAFGLVTFLMHEGLDRVRIRKHLIIFSLAAPVLAIITYFGISQSAKEALSSYNATGMAMLFSAGTFLYVATVHVLPEITSRSHSHSISSDMTSEAKGFRKIELLALVIGALLPLLLSVHHHH